LNNKTYEEVEMAERVCPWYLGYFLASPLRRLYQDPEKIFSPYVKPGMKVLEIGPGMGFFSLPLAKLVGETGHIYCTDIQKKMLESLRKRADRENLLERIDIRLCDETSLQIPDLAGSMDFALAFAVIHEVPNQKLLLKEIFDSLRKDGMLLIAEPKGHVTLEGFEKTLDLAQRNGMKKENIPDIRGSFSALLYKV
jgi:ubiquinone/menaquinone biosynthesis C-methylase UbiE